MKTEVKENQKYKKWKCKCKMSNILYINYKTQYIHMNTYFLQKQVIHGEDTYPDARIDPVGLHAQAHTYVDGKQIH